MSSHPLIFKLLAFTPCLLFGLTGCGATPDKKPSDLQASKKNIIYVHGDPKNIIAHTALNPKTVLTVDNIAKFSGFALYWRIFAEQEQIEEVPGAVVDLETQQTLIQEAPLEKEIHYEMKKIQDKQSGPYWVFEARENPADNIRLYFFKSDKNHRAIELKYLANGDVFLPVEVLHYSLKFDGTALSFLFLENNALQKNVLHSMVFGNVNESKKIEVKNKGEEGYKYIFKDRKVRWNSELPVKLYSCGELGSKFSKPIATAAGYWIKALQNRLDLRVEVSKKDCPPFSDLNFHGIYFVDGYKSEYGMVTLVEGSYNHPYFFDSDIFVNADVYTSDLVDMSLNLDDLDIFESAQILSDMTHEFGHFLGLDHKFKTSSTMSYEVNRQFDQYDKKAIQSLYPKVR